MVTPNHAPTPGPTGGAEGAVRVTGVHYGLAVHGRFLDLHESPTWTMWA